MDELTPRERVFLALSHKETDRVPVDFIATPETWTRLEHHLGVRGTEEVLRSLGVDLRHARQSYVGPPLERRADGSWTDAWGVCRRSVAHQCGGVYEEIVGHPLAEVEDAGELEDYPWPRPDWWSPDSVVEQIKAWDADRPYAIVLPEFGDPGGIFEMAWYLRGMERFLTDMLCRPDIAAGIMSRVADFFEGTLEQIMRAARGRIDLVWTSDDIAHQHGPMVSPRVWEGLIAPHHERLNRRIHELGTCVMYHSCGAVRRFIPGLIETGVDVLDVLQFSADGMDPAEIKASFGDRLSFHGGLDVQSTLPCGTVEEVRRITRERIDVLAKDGGYILAPTHNVQPDTPPENIVAMYAEAGSLRRSAQSRRLQE